MNVNKIGEVAEDKSQQLLSQCEIMSNTKQQKMWEIYTVLH